MADKHIREGNLAEAKVELDAVRAIEPNNVYALALEERRQALEKATKEGEVPAEEAAKPEAAAAVEEKPSEKPPVAVDEETIRAEIEQRLEIEYNKKFTEEIRKAEQRIAEALKKEREWQEAERASLIANLEKEKDKFRRELEKQSKDAFEIEVGKMEATYRQQLSAERKKAEEETRAEMSALYEKSMNELKESAVKEKRQLLEKERKALEESKKQMEDEFQKRLSGELAKGRSTSLIDHEKERERFESETRAKLQREFDDKLDADRRRIEEQIRLQHMDLERSYENRHGKLERETQIELNRRLEEIKLNEQREFERKHSELRTQLESEYTVKLAAELAKERERIEKQVEVELKGRQSKLESDRKKVVGEEQSKLDEARTIMKMEMEKEIERRVADAKNSVETIYKEKLKLLGVKLPDTREEKLRIYVTRLREAWEAPPVTPEAARELMQLRDIFNLSFEDHIEMEGEVRLQVYVTEVEKEIKRGHIRPNDDNSLEELKRRYQITPEEQKKLEPHILSAFQRAIMKAVILVVDDEAGFLETVRAVLEGYGYSVLTKQSPTDALKLLETTNVDMIIADVMFSGTEGDGFSFYERVQKIPHLKKVPFVLMSGLHESFFVRTGIQLGVDDYLTKPVDPDMLAAVVEGKLKKYKSLREAD
ncbi:MAG TPA: response regulator [Candidatus Acidoferrales bacterium]|nr:response regulator [Candidatus Acidoferrales bacterium]